MKYGHDDHLTVRMYRALVLNKERLSEGKV